jgi:hypothetical protein
VIDRSVAVELTQADNDSRSGSRHGASEKQERSEPTPSIAATRRLRLRCRPPRPTPGWSSGCCPKVRRPARHDGLIGGLSPEVLLVDLRKDLVAAGELAARRLGNGRKLLRRRLPRVRRRRRRGCRGRLSVEVLKDRVGVQDLLVDIEGGGHRPTHAAIGGRRVPGGSAAAGLWLIGEGPGGIAWRSRPA